MTTPESHGWRALPPIVLRSAGLPASLLEGLVVTRMRPVLGDLDAAHRRLAQQRRLLLPRLVAAVREAAPGEARPLRRVKELVLAGRPVTQPPTSQGLGVLIGEWNELIDQSEGLLQRCLSLAAEAEPAVSGALSSLVRDETVAESIFVNSPPALEAMEAATASLEGHPRRTLVAYLQRFAAKVETASLFGPVNFLAIEGDSAGGISLEVREPGWKAGRRVSLSYWAAQALATALRSNGCQESHLRLYRSAAPRAADGVAQDEIDAAVLAAADGSASIRGLALRLGLESSEIVDRARDLERRGALRIGLRIPGSAPEPLTSLVEMLEGEDIEGSSRQTLEFFGRWRAAFEAAPFALRRRLLPQGERAFTSFTARPARRGLGAFYGDRFIYTEEASGNLAGLVGADFLARLAARLSTALDLLASEAVEDRLDDHAEVLRLMGPDGGPAWRLAREPYQPPAVRLARSRLDRWRRLIPDPSQPVVRLTRADLEAAGMIREELDRWPLFCSPDLMLGGTPAEIAAGEPRLMVLSEAHHIFIAQTLLTRQFADRLDDRLDEILASLRRALHSGDLMVPAFDRQTKAVDYAATGMHLLCLDEVRREPGAVPVPVGDLTVDFASNRPRLRRGRRVYALLPDYGDFPPDPGMLRALALPAINKEAFSLGRHTPRVEIDGVVYQRERWDLTREDFDFASRRLPTRDQLRQLWTLKSRQGLPDRVFVKTAGEEKPFYVDFASPELCLLLLGHARGAASIALSEALPPPAESWLKTSAGRHCSELRLTVVRSAR